MRFIFVGATSVKKPKIFLRIVPLIETRTSGTESNLSKAINKGHLGLQREAWVLKVWVTWGSPVF